MNLRRQGDPTDTEVQQALEDATTCQTDGCTEPVHGTLGLCASHQSEHFAAKWERVREMER